MQVEKMPLPNAILKTSSHLVTQLNYSKSETIRNVQSKNVVFESSFWNLYEEKHLKLR